MNYFNRILIKLSGESLSCKNNEKFNFKNINRICNDLINVLNIGINISLVVGGGNIIRGRDFNNNSNIRREAADSIGMLATVINSIILRELLMSRGIDCVIVSPLDLPFGTEKLNIFSITEFYKANKFIIFAGGLGLPYFSTDTISVIGAILSKCDAIFKATQSDGVYSQDPKKFCDAIHLPKISYDYAIKNNLKIMDETAFLLAKQNNIPIYIFSINEDNCFIKAINKEIKYSLVHN